MSTIELVQIVLSFFLGGLVISALTWLVPKLGSTVGGIVGSVPTTLVVALLFQGVIVSPDHAASAAIASLISLPLFGFFCLTFYFMSAFKFWPALLGACVVWLCAAAPIVFAEITSFPLAFGLFVVISLLCVFFFSRLPVRSALPRPIEGPPSWGYVLRFFLSGGIVAFAVFLSLVAGQVWGGVFAAFPAAAMSTMIVLHRSEGCSFVAEYVKSLFFGAVLNSGVYITAVHYLYPALGLFLGTVLAYMMSLLCAYALYRLHLLRSESLTVE